jgi:TatD DNase family protein
MGLHPGLIDAHCHFDDDLFDADRDQAYARARAAGVSQQVIPGIKAAWWPRIKQLCEDYPGLYPNYGLHPMFIPSHTPGHLDQLRHWIEQEQPVAIGECGLDYFIEEPQKAQQQFYFEAQLDLAREFALPVVIHARRSVEEVIKTLRRFPGVTGMLHSYAGSEQQAYRLIDMGFCFSFGGAITYDRAKRLRRLIASLPLDTLLLETDAPDQPDSSHRGARNEPAYLPNVLETLHQLRKEPIEQITQQITKNTKRLFALQ